MIRKILFQIGVVCLLFAAVAQTGYANMYTDVPTDSKLNEQLTVLGDFGVVTAMPNQSFRAKDAITRYEAAEFIIRALQIDPELIPIPTY